MLTRFDNVFYETDMYIMYDYSSADLGWNLKCEDFKENLGKRIDRINPDDYTAEEIKDLILKMVEEEANV